eukprot:scpid4828/ scgid5452/ Leucine-rich repeat serine/threonine-protein kinase 1
MQQADDAAEDEDPTKAEQAPQRRASAVPLSSPTGSGSPAASIRSRRSLISSLRSKSSSSSTPSTSGGITEDQRFHRWCKEGKLNKVSDALNKGGNVDGLLKKRVGVYGYTPLHEAASYGHDEILKLLVMFGGDVNCKANSGYTPLHLAASSGRTKCVQRLLRAKADFFQQDGYGKTALQTAELGGKTDVIKILRSAEVIYAAERNADNLGLILQGLRKEDVEENTFNNGLNVCATYGYLEGAAKFIIKGATNYDHCVETAVKFRHYNVAALLLLCDAASTGDVHCIRSLFNRNAEAPPAEPENATETAAPAASSPLTRAKELFTRTSPRGRSKAVSTTLSRPRAQPARQSIGMAEPHITHIRRILLDGCVKTVHVINVALRANEKLAALELLLNTDCNRDNGNVDWHGLALRHIDPMWLQAIKWAKRLFLASNGLTKMPTQVIKCTGLQRLDLCRNALQAIPQEVVQLPMLRNLNLSRNQLRELPECSWTSSMAILDVSANELNLLPRGIQQTQMLSLNIRNNRFVEVPETICNLTPLQNLNISHNPKILVLPNIMGRLSNLMDLKLSGNEISDPPPEYLQAPRKCILYLRQRLRGCEPYYRMKLMVVGFAGRGKTTLVARLRGQTADNLSTVGIALNEWQYRPTMSHTKFTFNIWDFGGQEVYYATHQCFMTKRSLYLVLFNIMHGKEGIEELRTWLDNIVAKAGRSIIIIVATHKDKVTPEMEAANYATEMLEAASNLTDLPQYCELNVFITSISNADTPAGIHSVEYLKNLIYDKAEQYELRSGKVMGERIPASYFRLDRAINEKRAELEAKEAPQIIRHEELKAIIEDRGITDIDNDEELKYAAEFLHNVGTLLHYDDSASGLCDLYFTDPSWLSDMMAKVVTVRERNPYMSAGILLRSDVPQLFRDKRFPKQLFDQYLSLLARFEIALPLDSERIMIPSMLPEEAPALVQEFNTNVHEPELVLRRHHKVIGIPAGFWSRLISRLIYTLREVIEKFGILSDKWHDLPKGASADSKPVPGAATPTTQRTLMDASDNSDANLEHVSSDQSEEEASQDSRASSRAKRAITIWRQGVLFAHPELFFCVRPYASTRPKYSGIETMTSVGFKGRHVLGLIIDHINKLAQEWYPGLEDNTFTGEPMMEMIIPCTMCTQLGHTYPHLFSYEECSRAARTGRVITCPRHKDTDSPLENLVPELLLLDLPEQFLLKENDVACTRDEDSRLGTGGFGTVYRGEVGDLSVAIKTFNEQEGESGAVFKEIRQEVAILKRIYHRHLVGLVGVTLQPLQLVLELAPSGSLSDLCKKIAEKSKPKLERMLLFNIGAQVAMALSYMHSRNIIFRDLKSANVLLFSMDIEQAVNVKLTDYGIASTVAPSGIKGFEGTKGFQAPEILRYNGMEEYTTKVDIYSLAIFMYELLALSPPFTELNEAHITNAVIAGQRPRLMDVPNVYCGLPGWSGVMFQCWRDSITTRPSADEVVDGLLSPDVISMLGYFAAPTTRSVRKAAFVPATGDVWLFCDDAHGIDVLIIKPTTMELVKRFSIDKLQVKNALVVNNNMVWLGIKDGLRPGQILVYDAKNVGQGSTKFRISGIDDCIFAMAVCKDNVAISTMDGRISMIPASCKNNLTTRSFNVGDFPVSSMVCVGKNLWCASKWYIFIYDVDTLAFKCQFMASAVEGRQIEEMKLSMDGNTVWCSVYDHWLLNGWNSHTHRQSCTIDITHALDSQPGASHTLGVSKTVITSMETCLDTLWLGLSSGEILVYDEEGTFLSRMQPYSEWVRLLTYCAQPGPCGHEEGAMFSGGKGFKCPELAMAEAMDSVLRQSKLPQSPASTLSSSVMINGPISFVTTEEVSEATGGMAALWETFPARKTKLMYQRSVHLKEEVGREAEQFRSVITASESDDDSSRNEWNPSSWRAEWESLQSKMPRENEKSSQGSLDGDGVHPRASSTNVRHLAEKNEDEPKIFKSASKVCNSETATPLLQSNDVAVGCAAAAATASQGEVSAADQSSETQSNAAGAGSKSSSVYCSNGPSISDNDDHQNQ